jgi:hypothetical protein
MQGYGSNDQIWRIYGGGMVLSVEEEEEMRVRENSFIYLFLKFLALLK